MLIPTIGAVKPSQRVSLTTLENEIESYSKKAINLETGHIYLRD